MTSLTLAHQATNVAEPPTHTTFAMLLPEQRWFFGHWLQTRRGELSAGYALLYL